MASKTTTVKKLKKFLEMFKDTDKVFIGSLYKSKDVCIGVDVYKNKQRLYSHYYDVDMKVL